MHEYTTKPYEDVNNSQYKFYKLYIDGKCQFDEFLKEIERSKSDKKLFKYIISYMDGITDQNRFPFTKFNHIHDEDRHDIFEFKKDRIRVYVIKQKPNFYIVIGGFKGTQDKDIDKLKLMIKDFPKE